MNFVDPLGLDIWHINDEQGAGGAGHSGAIVGSGNHYTYHAFYGKHGKAKGEGEYHYKEFNSLEAAMAYAKKEGYDRWAQYSTCPEKDELARQAADKWSDKNYLVTYTNCIQLVNNMMMAADLPWRDLRAPNFNFNYNIRQSDKSGIF